MTANTDNNEVIYVQGYLRSESGSIDKCYGVTQHNEPVTVSIVQGKMEALHKKHEGNVHAVIPDFDRIARGNAKKAGCIGASDNCPDNRTGGMLLLDGVTRGANVDGRTQLSTEYVKVLAHNKADTEPFVGIVGWVERAPHFTTGSGKNIGSPRTMDVQLQMLQAKMRHLLASGDPAGATKLINDIKTLQVNKDDLVRNRHRLVQMDLENTSNFKLSTIDRSKRIVDRLVNEIQATEKNGALGGIMIRVLDKEGRIVLPASGQIHTRFDLNARTPANPSGSVTKPLDAVREYMSTARGGNLYNLSSEYSVQIIPTPRWNFGGNSNNKYARKEEADKLFEAFKHSTDSGNMARVVAATVFHPKSGDTNVKLISDVFTMGPQIGSPLTIGLKGHILDFSRDTNFTAKHNKIPLTIGEEYIIELSDGDRSVAMCRNSKRGIGMYSGNERIEDYNLIGPAPSRGLNLSR